MSQPKLIVLVKFASKLPLEEIMKIAVERADDFRALPGLLQKYYFQDAQTGEYGGLYHWDSQEAFDAYRSSALRASIAAAYQVEGAPRVEVYAVQMPLREA